MVWLVLFTVLGWIITVLEKAFQPFKIDGEVESFFLSVLRPLRRREVVALHRCCIFSPPTFTTFADGGDDLLFTLMRLPYGCCIELDLYLADYPHEIAVLSFQFTIRLNRDRNSRTIG